MNISAHYFNHGCTVCRCGGGGGGDCFISVSCGWGETPSPSHSPSLPALPLTIIKLHAVCIWSLTSDLQDLLKSTIKKQASLAIKTCNLIPCLLMGLAVIYTHAAVAAAWKRFMLGGFTGALGQITLTTHSLVICL